MLKKIVFDFSYVLLFPKNSKYVGKLNELNDKLASENEYEPLDYFQINTELIDFLEDYKNSYEFFIFTAGKMHKLPSLRKSLSRIFTNYLSESDVGLPKNDPEAFIKLAGMLTVKPLEILFIDDKQENVTAAQKAGLQSLQFQSNDQLVEQLRAIL